MTMAFENLLSSNLTDMATRVSAISPTAKFLVSLHHANSINSQFSATSSMARALEGLRSANMAAITSQFSIANSMVRAL